MWGDVSKESLDQYKGEDYDLVNSSWEGMCKKSVFEIVSVNDEIAVSIS